jgi:hypothetical protein
MSFVPTLPDRRDRTLEDPVKIADLSALKDAGDIDDSKAPSNDFVLDNPASEIVHAPEHADSGAVVDLEAATSGGVFDREFIGPPSQIPQLSETPDRLADGPKPDTPSCESSELSDLVLGDALNASNSTRYRAKYLQMHLGQCLTPVLFRKALSLSNLWSHCLPLKTRRQWRTTQ